MNPLLWVLHGPNLNLLGTREPGIYGHTTLADINRSVSDLAQQSGVAVECFQSNHEGQLIDQIHKAPASGVGFVIINPGAFTHTSVAIRDALAGVAVPFVEVHLSNVHKREPFRHHSYFSDLAAAVVVGMGPEGYLAATRFAVKALSSSHPK